MLWAAAAAVVATATLSPQHLVLTPKDVPASFVYMVSASGPTAPNAYRAAFAAGRTARVSSVAVVLPDAQTAAAQVAAPATNCGRAAGTRKLRVGAPLGDGAVLCASSSQGYDAYAVAWRDGRVFATIAIVGRPSEVSSALALRLARAQEARIARARGSGLAA